MQGSGGFKNGASLKATFDDSNKMKRRTNSLMSEGNLVYEDPAAALNFSEDQWNQIVQDNLKKHYEDEARAEREKREKRKRI